MKPDDFEEQLERQPVRQIPGEWRGRILDTARRTGDPQLATLNPQPSSRLQELLWPSPRAWAGLAAVWAVVLALNAATREPVSVAEAVHPSPPREVLMALREQRRLFLELIEPSPPARQSRTFVPRPRSEISRRTGTV